MAEATNMNSSKVSPGLTSGIALHLDIEHVRLFSPEGTFLDAATTQVDSIATSAYQMYLRCFLGFHF